MMMADEGGSGGGSGGGGSGGSGGGTSPSGGAGSGGSAGGSPAPGSSGGLTTSVGRDGNTGASGATPDVVSGEDGFSGFDLSDEHDVVEASPPPTLVPPQAAEEVQTELAPSVPPPPQPQTPPGQLQPHEIVHPSQVTLENVDAALNASRDALVNHWAQNYFQLTPEQADALVTQPEAVLPQLLAKGLFLALSAIPSQIKQFVPSLVNSTIETQTKHQSSANEFYSAWPGLRGHEQAAVSAIKMIVAQNPNVTRSEAIRLSGAMVCAMLGIDPRVAAPKGTGGGRVAPAVVSQTPMVPAGAGGGSASAGNGAMPPPTGDWWDSMDLPFSG